MKIVIDTNIIFSAILNTQSKIGQILISGSQFFDFYSIGLLQEEIRNHQDKILNISKYSIQQYEEIYRRLISKITFIDDELLLDSEIDIALTLTKDIDENDTLFVALANQLHSYLWTGDKKLHIGLHAKGYNRIITTEEMYQMFLERQYQITS